MFRPRVEFLEPPLLERILGEAFALLWEPGVVYHWAPALKILAAAGARVDFATGRAQISEALILRTLDTAPREFYLYDAAGEPRVHYGGDDIHFDPGSAAVSLYDGATRQYRAPTTRDFVQYARLAEQLPAFDALSTALVCADVPIEIADWYRLYLCLRLSDKPIVTGAFAVETFAVMRELLRVVAGSDQKLVDKPLAVFDACPSPPLQWSEITGANLIEGAQTGVPMELVAMPLAGAAAPVTLIGAVVQHVAENLSGIVLHQSVRPGAPIVFGGAPAIFDMREGITPLAALESVLMTCAYTQIGKHLHLPTHGYLGLADTKVPDLQAGWETSIGAVLGALAGVNMMSGAGMLDCSAAFSIEKMVADAEVIAMAKRMVRGITPVGEGTLALEMLRQVGHAGNFLETEQTLAWFRREQIQHSPVVDRLTRRTWEENGAPDTFARAREYTAELLAHAPSRALARGVEGELIAIATREARRWGMERLPEIGGFDHADAFGA